MSNAERMTTYKLKSGDPVYGEYSWVTTLDYFDEDDEPNDLIEEVWECVSFREFKYPTPKCIECDNTDRQLFETDDGLLCAPCAAEYGARAAASGETP